MKKFYIPILTVSAALLLSSCGAKLTVGVPLPDELGGGTIPVTIGK